MAPNTNHEAHSPYQDIIVSLVNSTFNAIGEFAKAASRGQSLSSVSDARINSYFCWLTYEYKEGIHRHLFEAPGRKPLRTQLLRNRRKLPSDIKEKLISRSPIDPFVHVDKKKSNKKQDGYYVQQGATRISSLIRLCCEEVIVGTPYAAGLIDEKQNENVSISIPSPLKIVLKILTVPDVQGSDAYPLLTLRNYLFDAMEVLPKNLHTGGSSISFSPIDLENALSHAWTSFRPRYWSGGKDKLPPTGGVDGLVRHFMAMKGLVNLRFKTSNECLSFFRKKKFPLKNNKSTANSNSINYEFDKASDLARLPDLGEVVNEICGLPIPIRGSGTILRGGLKFTSSDGLVCVFHGGPGSGKTSLALALGASLSPFGVVTLFATGEEREGDLRDRCEGLVPDEIRRNFDIHSDKWLNYLRIDPRKNREHLVLSIKEKLISLANALSARNAKNKNMPGVPMICTTVVVLDGIHDILAPMLDDNSGNKNKEMFLTLYDIVETCREVGALVVLTTGIEWRIDTALDYMVDVSMRLSHEYVDTYGQKPERRLILTKTRNQLSSPGSHGLQISGSKGARFSPQINFELDRLAQKESSLANQLIVKDIFLKTFPTDHPRPQVKSKSIVPFSGRRRDPRDLYLFQGASVFLNGRGSGGKASLALKIATAPSFQLNERGTQVELIKKREKVLVLSFLYPKEYYVGLRARLNRLRAIEYSALGELHLPQVDVIQFYPGALKPHELFNKVEWSLEAAELIGDPYTSVVIDGIHNIFLQFPEIEKYSVLWPQLFSALRRRALTVISTHTTLVMEASGRGSVEIQVDDHRSEPLRHALVQKSDFHIDVSPPGDTKPSEYVRGDSNIFAVKALSAIGQPIPSEPLYWSREKLVFYDQLPLNLVS